MSNIYENMIMKAKFKTSINITAPAINAYQRMIRRYSAKLTISAAIIAFDKMTASDQLKFIDLASSDESPEGKTEPRRQLHDAMDLLREMVDIENQQPGTIYRVLDSNEQKVLDDFRKLMMPKDKKSRSA